MEKKRAPRTAARQKLGWEGLGTRASPASPEEVSLLGLAEAADADVRQQLFLKDVLGVLDPPLARDSRLCPPDADEVESDVLLLDHEGLVQGGLQLVIVICVDYRGQGKGGGEWYV